MRRRPFSRAAPTAVAAVLVPALVAGGCSSPFGGDGDASGPESAPAGETVARSHPQESLAVGESAEWQGAQFTVTAVRRPFGSPGRAPDGAGLEWLGVRAVTCAGDASVETAWYLFAAYGPSSERYPATRPDAAGWPPQPYPQGTVDPGECVDGWVLFPVVAGEPVATVRLADPDGLPLGEWLLPKGDGR